VRIFSDLGHRRGIARALEGSASIAVVQGDATRALKLAAAAARLRALISAPLTPAEQSNLDHDLRLARESLGELEGNEAWAEGSTMSLEMTVQYSLEEPRPFTSVRQG
jgi:hypothetical protein